MSKDEGIVKFQCNWQVSAPVFNDKLHSLIHYRNLLFDHKLIGCYQDGIGYGNISCRDERNSFFISGSATGDVVEFSEKHISLVTDFDIKKNSLNCIGPAKASSESLSHAIIYKLLPEIQAVIHVHSSTLWNSFQNKLPTTNPSVAYGTPEMAGEIQKLLKNNDGIIIMGGHEEGIISYGQNFSSAFSLIEKLMK